MKKKSVLIILCFLLAASAVGRIAWIRATSVSLEESSASPDGKIRARIWSRWSARFWGGTGCESHDIRLETKEGRLIRRVSTEESWTGWPKNSVVKWEPDSASVVVRFKAEEALPTQLVLRVVQ